MIKLTKKQKETIKRHVISAVITFSATFFLVFGTNLSVESLDTAGITAILVTAVRAGLKALVEYLQTIK